MNKYFFNIEEAKKFAKENNCVAVELKQWREADSTKFSMFNIDGYSEVVRAFCFSQYVNATTQEKYWSYEDYVWVLRIIETGQCFYVRSYSRGKFFMFPLEREYHERDRGFKYNEPEPNYIGKATQKKIQRWVDFCNAKDKARIEFANNVLRMNKEFVDRFKRKYPNANYNTRYDGWTSEFSLYTGCLYIKYTAYENGGFGRDIQVVYSKVPTTEDLLK